MDWALLLQAVQDTASIIGDGHILDYIGVGSPGALAVHFYYQKKIMDDARGKVERRDAEIVRLTAEANKYQDKWIAAVEAKTA